MADDLLRGQAQRAARMLREIAATYLCACARVREVHVCGCKRAHTHTHWVQRMRQSIRMHAPLLEHQLAVCCILEPHGRLDLRAPPPPVRHNFPRVLCPPHTISPGCSAPLTPILGSSTAWWPGNLQRAVLLHVSTHKLGRDNGVGPGQQYLHMNVCRKVFEEQRGV